MNSVDILDYLCRKSDKKQNGGYYYIFVSGSYLRHEYSMKYFLNCSEHCYNDFTFDVIEAHIRRIL